MERSLQQFIKSRSGEERLHALASIHENLSVDMDTSLLKNYFVNFLEKYIECIQLGCSEELMVLGSEILAISGYTDPQMAHQALQEIVHLRPWDIASKAHKFFDCMAILAICGSNTTQEIESAMNSIWKVVVCEPPDNSIVARSLSAWTCIVTAVNFWELTGLPWKNVGAFIVKCMASQSSWRLQIAALESLGVLMEINGLSKFGFVKDQGGCQKVAEQLDSIKGHNSRLSALCKFFETGKWPSTSRVFDGEVVIISTFAESFRVDFILKFFGSSLYRSLCRGRINRVILKLQIAPACSNKLKEKRRSKLRREEIRIKSEKVNGIYEGAEEEYWP